jgi:hypothetical protein
MSNIKTICPACGFLTNDSKKGQYNICAVCGWEDDPVQSKDPNFKGGANDLCLNDFKEQVLKKFPLSVKTAKGCLRDEDWITNQT